MAKHPKHFSRKSHMLHNPPPTAFNCPAVSVIIPLYNVEKYIGECLDSVLAQTFKDFEVIVVDDCSTDSSPAIVESYAPKFGGRLILLHMKKNSGSAGFPRNKGIEFARGDYVYFFDSDDTITPTALEELYSLAKEYDADVVQCEKYYDVPEDSWYDAELRKRLKPYNYLTGEKILIHKPLVGENNFEERIKFFRQKKLIWNVVVQLIRREFIIKNNIKFCDIFAEDMLFSICELCAAKKYVVVPNAVYYYRTKRSGSTMTMRLEIAKQLHRQIKALTEGVEYLDKFLSDNEFFVRRPDLKYMLFDAFVSEMSSHLLGIYARVPAPALDELLRKEFGGDNVALTSFIFNAMNIYRLQLMQSQQRIAALETELKRLKG